MKLEKEVQLLSGAIDKAFKSGVYGVQEAQQILIALGAIQAANYSDSTKQMAEAPEAPMEVVEDEPKKK